MRIDARIPLRFGPLSSRAADDAVLLDDDQFAAPPLARLETQADGHAPDCRCCTPRSAAATALAALFRQRAVGQGTPFRAVLAVVSPVNEAAVRAALAVDPVAAGRYRLG